MLELRAFTFNAFSENTYLILNGQKDCWIVDPGMNDERETNAFLNYLQQEELRPVSIINTHTHIDHILGVQALKDAYGIPFGMHKAETLVLQGAKGSAMLFGLTLPVTPQPDFFIQEGTTIALGDDLLEVRLVPGHSPGSIAFYYKEGQWAISGDALFAGSIGRTDLPGGDFDTLIRSIRAQLFTLPDETTIYPGHGGPTTIGREKAGNPFLS